MTSTIQKPKRIKRISLFKPNVEHKVTRSKNATRIPAANIDETDTEYVLTLAAPGFDKETIQVLIKNATISISAYKKILEGDCIHDRCEFDYSDWERIFSLPEDADALMTRAQYSKGELKIWIPKGKSNSSPSAIPVYVY